MHALPLEQRDGYIWLNGELIPWHDAKLHVLAHGLHYGGSVFEGERAYGGKIFRSRQHSRRLKLSAEALDFEIPYSVSELDSAKKLVLDKNGMKDAYIRPIAWRCSSSLAIGAQDASVQMAIAVWEWPSKLKAATEIQGVRLDIADYSRPDPKTAPSHAKAAGLYMICTVSKHRAERRGFTDALMLDWQGRVAECTGSNVFFTRDGQIHTPIADCFLDGITRRAIIDLAKQHNINVVERRIMPNEFGHFDECFITGTATEVQPVTEILGYRFAIGDITLKLIENYRQVVHECS